MSEDAKLLLSAYILTCIIFTVILGINTYRWIIFKNKNPTSYKASFFNYMFDEDNVFTSMPTIFTIILYSGYLLHFGYNLIYNSL